MNSEPVQLPPCTPDAEELVLGSMMCGPDQWGNPVVEVFEILSPDRGDWFADSRRRYIFGAICSLHDHGDPVTPATVGAVLGEWGNLVEVGGKDYLDDLAARAVSAADARPSARKVRAVAERRRLWLAGLELTRAAADGKPISDIVADTQQQLAGTSSTGDGETCTPILTCMADVRAKEVQWFWLGRIPLGCITLLVGKPGECKTYLATDAAARLSTGTPWPDGTPCPSGSTILISAEDDPATILRPRLDVHYADVNRVHLLSAVRRADPSGKSLEVLFTLRDVDALESALRSLQDVRLIVIDPIGSFLGARTDAHRDNEVRSVLAPVAQLAAKYGAAALVIAHRRKATGSTADELAIGSRAFTGIARAVWHVSRDGQSERRLLLPGKMNVGRPASGLAFTVAGEPVARIIWEREPVHMTADQALAVEAQEGGGQGVREQAKEWLRDLLAAGPVPVKDIESQGKAAGFLRHTLRRAREEMPIRVFKLPGAMGGPWHWRLKTGDSAEGVQEDVHLP